MPKADQRAFYANNIGTEYKHRAFHEDENISQENKKEVDRFINNKIAKSGIKERRVSKYYSSFRRILILAGKDIDLKNAEEDEFDKILRAINDSTLSNESKCDFRKYLKAYLRSRNGGELPKWARDIKSRIGEMKVMLPEDIPTKEEVESLISVCNNERDRCLIKLVSEAGIRSGEIGSLMIKHFQFSNMGCEVSIPTTEMTKTGGRKVLVIESEAYIKSWLKAHPWGKNQDASMWVLIEQNQGKMKVMTYDGMRRMLYNKAVKAGVDPGKCNLHNFRHHAATEKAKWMTDQQMMQYFGWRTSDMVRRYTHLSGRDMNAAILSHYGLSKADEQEKPICPRCGMLNLAGASYCSRCQVPLNMKVALEADEKQKKRENILGKLARDPAVLKLLADKLEKEGNLEEVIDALS